MIEQLLNAHTLLATITGFLLGLILLWLIYRSKANKLTDQNIELERKLAVEIERAENREQRIEELNNTVRERENTNKYLQKDVENSKVTVAELVTKLDQERKSMQEKMVLLEQAETKMTNAFENLSNKILEEKSRKFTDQNKLNIGEVLKSVTGAVGRLP